MSIHSAHEEESLPDAPTSVLELRSDTQKQMERLAIYNDCKLIAIDGEVHASRVMIGSVSEVLRRA